MKPENNIAIFLHLYYFDLWGEFSNLLKQFPYSFNLYVNLVEQGIETSNLQTNIKQNFPAALILVSPNQGADIGGQIRLINERVKLKLKEKYIIFLHGKKSPQYEVEHGEHWRKQLLRIIHPLNSSIVLNTFAKKAHIGIIGSKEFHYTSDMDVIWRNMEPEKINRYSKTFGFDFSNRYDFIAGTMFWIRAEILETFFLKFNPLAIVDDFETGHDGITVTKAQVFERMFGMMARNSKYEIGVV